MVGETSRKPHTPSTAPPTGSGEAAACRSMFQRKKTQILSKCLRNSGAEWNSGGGE